MATLESISYTYVPTVPRSKSTKAPRKPYPKQVSILDKIQLSKPSSSALGTPRPPAEVAAADDSRNDGSGFRSMP